MKRGILGGTFNPVHLGHIRIALEVMEKAGLDEILFIPSGTPPHKPSGELAPAADRYEMVRLAIAGHPQLKISPIEIDRKEKSYTIDTIRALKSERPGDIFFFIIGLDAFMEIPTWKESSALFNLVHFIVVSRPGHHFREIIRLPFFKNIPVTPLEALDRHTISSYELPSGPSTVTILLHIEPVPVSSSEIRKKIKKGEFENNFLPGPVKSYIIEKKVF